MVIFPDFGKNAWSSKLHKSTTGICQNRYLKFEMLHCSSKKSGSKASVEGSTCVAARLSLTNSKKM